MAEGVNSSMIYLIHCKNSCKCHNVPPPSTAIKKQVNWFHFFLIVFSHLRVIFAPEGDVR
jgi:hypothetical protein